MDLNYKELKFEPFIPHKAKKFIIGLLIFSFSGFYFGYVNASKGLADNKLEFEVRNETIKEFSWFARPIIKDSVNAAIYMHNKNYNIIGLLQKSLN